VILQKRKLGRRQVHALECLNIRRNLEMCSYPSDFNPRVLASLRRRGLIEVWRDGHGVDSVSLTLAGLRWCLLRLKP
jgi:hypothetical protein